MNAKAGRKEKRRERIQRMDGRKKVERNKTKK